jgi:hypothetical protein
MSETFEWSNEEKTMTVFVEVGPEGLIWSGEDWSHPAGGGYAIGKQSIEEFMTKGPLVSYPPMSKNTQESLRRYLQKNILP